MCVCVCVCAGHKSLTELTVVVFRLALSGALTLAAHVW